MGDNYSYGIILSMGAWCECVSPQYVRDEVAQRVRRMLSIYEPS
jgi:predicted DNA-binding transcriptional regulator YafY